MGQLAGALKTELQKPGHGELWLVTLNLPDATLKGSMVGVASDANGQYQPHVEDISDINFGLSIGGLDTPEVTVTWHDADRRLIAQLESSTAHRVRYSAATIQLGSPNVAPANWATQFTGVISRIPALSGDPFSFTITLRADDLALTRAFPKVSITPGDWPDADPDIYDEYAPLIYGKHDATGKSNTGAVPLLLADRARNQYIVSLGYLKAVDRVFSGGLLQSSGYTVEHPVKNGRVWTVVTFTASQGEKAITADVQGFEAVGDGSGALIDNTADQIKHLLVNWVYGDYKSGAWLSVGSTPIDTTSFTAAATFLTTYGRKGSRRFAGKQRRTGEQALTEWSESEQIPIYWTEAGKLAPRADEFATLNVFIDDPWIQHDEHELQTPTTDDPADEVVDRITVEYVTDEAQGSYVENLEVRDPTVSKEAPDSMQLPWSAAYVSRS